jgi:hypothetical protein
MTGMRTENLRDITFRQQNKFPWLVQSALQHAELGWCFRCCLKTRRIVVFVGWHAGIVRSNLLALAVSMGCMRRDPRGSVHCLPDILL